jgi:hypothetical protein
MHGHPNTRLTQATGECCSKAHKANTRSGFLRTYAVLQCHSDASQGCHRCLDFGSAAQTAAGLSARMAPVATHRLSRSSRPWATERMQLQLLNAEHRPVHVGSHEDAAEHHASACSNGHVHTSKTKTRGNAHRASVESAPDAQRSGRALSRLSPNQGHGAIQGMGL